MTTQSRGCSLFVVACGLLCAHALPASSAAAVAGGATDYHGRELVTHSYTGIGGGTTYGQRNQNSWLGFLIGIALLGLAPLLLVMTELQGVKFAKLLSRARSSTLDNVSSTSISAGLDGVMCHTVGPLSVEAGDTVYTDKDTGVTFGHDSPASATVDSAAFSFPLRSQMGPPSRPSHRRSTPMRIERTVEMYQWVEREEQGDYDSQVHYTSQWSEVDMPSSGFKLPGYDNPRRKIPIYSSMETRPRPCIGAYALGEAAVAKADWWSDCSVSEQTALPSAFTAAGARFFNGAIIVPSGNPQVAPGEPAIGDLKVTYRTVELPETEVTAIGVQEAGGLRPYTPEDVSKLTGRRPSGELAGDLNEEEFKRAAATLGEFKECGLRCCCTAFTTLTALFGQVMLFFMKQVVGTDVLLLSPLKKSSTGMYLSEEIRLEKALMGFRIAGTVLFILAFYLCLHPIAALFSFFPFLGRLIASLFLVAAILVGLLCSLVTIVGAWTVAKPFRACIGNLVLGAFYYPEYYYDGGSLVPLVGFGVLAALSGCFALYQLYQDCSFRQKARAGLAGASYVQVGMPVADAVGKPVAANKEKEMV